MRRTVGAIALLILLAAGVVVNSLTPTPGVKPREAVGELKLVDTLLGSFTYRKNGSGPCVVLVPSLGREASDFNELTTKLVSAGYQTFTVEHGGIGKSAKGHAETTYHSTFSIEIINAKECGYQQPLILIGHAYGNRIVRHHANQSKIMDGFDVSLLDRPTEPSVISGVILLAAGGQMPMPPEAEQSLKNIFNPLRTYRSRMKDLRYAFFADGNEIPSHWTRGWHTKTAMAQAKAVANSASNNSWHCAGGVPMLIVQPMQDRIAPIENAYALSDKCPQEVEIVEVQNAGHALLPEQPEAVATAVLDFLAKHHPTDHNKQDTP